MINLDQAKLLETKVAKAIDYIQELTKVNAALRHRESEYQTALETYQNRIDELEVLVMRFKKDQGVIEDSILAALDRLNQFEEAVEKCLWDAPDSAGKTGSKSGKQPEEAAVPKPADGPETEREHSGEQEPVLAESISDDSVNEKIYFEIQETEVGDDIIDPLIETLDKELQEQDGELDIF